MLAFGLGLLVVLHGLVHLWYVAQSRRMIELRPGLTWPDDSWAFSKALGARTTRRVAGATYVVAAVGLTVGGTALLLRQEWWRPPTVAAAAFSAVVIILFWDGARRRLRDEGGIGLLLDLVLLVALLVVRWPSPRFQART